MEKEFKIGDKIITTGNANHCLVPIGTIGNIIDITSWNSIIIDSHTKPNPFISKGNYKHYIEELPVFKIIKERAKKITMVQNNEGNIFGIGDTVKFLPEFGKSVQDVNKVMKITGFRYRNDRTNLCAVTDTHPEWGVGIEKIQHVLEFEKEFILPEKWAIKANNQDEAKILFPHFNKFSKFLANWKPEKYEHIHMYCATFDKNLNYHGAVSQTYCELPFITFEQFRKYVLKEEEVVKEETLLEKAKRLYTPGTRFIANNTNTECIVTTGIYKETTTGKVINEYSENGELLTTKNVFHNILDYRGNWAKILNPKLKVGDIFVLVGSSHPLTITNIQIINDQEVAFFKTHNGYSSAHTRILTKNIKEWTSV